MARLSERAQVPGGDSEVNKPDIPPELAQLCDPWMQHLWGLRGTYVGTQIDWPFREQPCSTSLETGGKVKHGNNQLQPPEDP